MALTCTGGHQNPDGAAFCATCGLALSQTPSPPASWPQTAAAAPAQPTWSAPQTQSPSGWSSFGPQASLGTPAAAGYPSMGARPQNGMGTAALILGIVSLFCFGFVTGVLAVIFGAIGIQKANNGQATNKTMAMWGLVLGIVGLVGWTFFMIASS